MNKPIEQMMHERDEEDVIEIGRIAETLLMSNAGKLLYGLVNSIVDSEEMKSENGITKSSAEFRLGRISGARLVTAKLEQAIAEGKARLSSRMMDMEKEAEREGEKSQVVYRGQGVGSI